MDYLFLIRQTDRKVRSVKKQKRGSSNETTKKNDPQGIKKKLPEG